MNRFRTQHHVRKSLIEHKSLNIEEMVNVEVAQKMANFLLESFKIEVVDGFPDGSKDYLIDLFVGEYSDIKKVNSLLNRIIEYTKLDTGPTGNIIAHHVYAIKTILFNNLKQKSK